MSDKKHYVKIGQFDNVSPTCPEFVCKQLTKRFSGCVEFCFTKADQENCYYVVVQTTATLSQNDLLKMRDMVQSCAVAIATLNGCNEIKFHLG
jgi:hypothetical protein